MVAIKRRSRFSGALVRDVDPSIFVKHYAAFLKKRGNISTPEWVDIAKTGIHREMPPDNPDWYYVRLAAVARSIYLRPHTGVGALRRKFGGSRNNGVRPSHKTKASGGILRKCLQQLEKLGLVEKEEEGGRKISRKGQKELDLIATVVKRKY